MVRGHLYPAAVQQRHLAIVHDLDRATHARAPHAFDELAERIDDEFDLVRTQQTGRIQHFHCPVGNLRIGTRPSGLPSLGAATQSLC